MRHTILVAALLAVTGSATGQSTEADAAKEVTKLSKQITEAYVKGDTAFLNGVLADDWMVISPMGAVEDKEQNLKNLKEGTFKYETMDKSEMKVRVYGDAAVVTGRIQTKLSFKGQTVGGPVSFTEVYVRRGGAWRNVSVQVTRVEAPPA